jgi:hypothetical protein
VVVPANSLDLDPFLLVSDAATVFVLATPAAEPCRWLNGRPPPMTTPQRLASIGAYLI